GEAGPLRLLAEDRLDDVFLAILGLGLELELPPDLAQLGDAHLAQVADVEVIPLAGGLELLHLVVFGHWCAATAASELATSSGPAVSGALIWSCHGERGHLLGKLVMERRLKGRRAHPRQDESARGPGWGYLDYKHATGRRQSSRIRGHVPPWPRRFHSSVGAVRRRRRRPAPRRTPPPPAARRAAARPDLRGPGGNDPGDRGAPRWREGVRLGRAAGRGRRRLSDRRRQVGPGVGRERVGRGGRPCRR